MFTFSQNMFVYEKSRISKRKATNVMTEFHKKQGNLKLNINTENQKRISTS